MKRKEYHASSKKGGSYMPLIDEYLQHKAEHDDLMRQWDALYKVPPRKIQFPLRKKTPDPIPYESFDTMLPDQNPRPKKITYNVDGIAVRVKNEAVMADLIKKEMGYRLLYETSLNLSRYYDNNPDIVFEVPEIQKIIVIEIDGAMEDEEDSHKAELRRKSYVRAGYREMKDVIFIRLTNTAEGVTLDVDYLRQMIIAAINMSIEDIIL